MHFRQTFFQVVLVFILVTKFIFPQGMWLAVPVWEFLTLGAVHNEGSSLKKENAEKLSSMSVSGGH